MVLNPKFVSLNSCFEWRLKTTYNEYDFPKVQNSFHSSTILQLMKNIIKGHTGFWPIPSVGFMSNTLGLVSESLSHKCQVESCLNICQPHNSKDFGTLYNKNKVKQYTVVALNMAIFVKSWWKFLKHVKTLPKAQLAQGLSSLAFLSVWYTVLYAFFRQGPPPPVDNGPGHFQVLQH